MQINEIFRILEARDPRLDYEEDIVKKTGEISRLIVTLEGTDSAVMTKLAKKYKKLDDDLKVINDARNALNQEVKDQFENLFDAEDAYVTRVIETVSITATLAKMMRESDFVPEEKTSWEKVAKEILDMLEGDLLQRAEEIKKMHTKLTKFDPDAARSPALRVKVKESTQENIEHGHTFCDINLVNKFTNYLENWSNKYGHKLNQLRSVFLKKRITNQ